MWALWVAAALADDCAEIRHVRGLAHAQALDERALIELERRTCGALVDSPECRQLSQMAAIGLAGGGAPEVERRAARVCAGAPGGADAPWSTGSTARYTNGAWNWPNGTTAMYANGAWNYPNGTTAMYANGAWNYPDGATAKYSNGSWNAPGGRSVASADALVTLACERLSIEACTARVQGLQGLQGAARDAAVVGLAWDTLR